MPSRAAEGSDIENVVNEVPGGPVMEPATSEPKLPELAAEIEIRWRGETVTVRFDRVSSDDRDRLAWIVTGIPQLFADLCSIKSAREKDPAGWFGDRGQAMEADVAQALRALRGLMADPGSPARR